MIVTKTQFGCVIDSERLLKEVSPQGRHHSSPSGLPTKRSVRQRSGFHVRVGRRQSIPSSNIDSWARVSSTVGLWPDKAAAFQTLRK